jgi:hypothetical protein
MLISLWQIAFTTQTEQINILLKERKKYYELFNTYDAKLFKKRTK